MIKVEAVSKEIIFAIGIVFSLDLLFHRRWGGLRWWCMRRSASLSLGFTTPLAWRSLICRLGRRQGRLGRLPFNA